MVFNKKVYKDLLTERSTLEKDPGVASRSILEQQDTVGSGSSNSAYRIPGDISRYGTKYG